MKLNKWFYLIALSLIWGSSFILIKKALVGLEASQLGSLRIIFSSIFIFLIAWRNIFSIKKIEWKWITISAFLGSFFPAFLFAFAEKEIDSSVASIINSIVPLNTLILGMIIFKIESTKRQIIGVLIGFFGTYLLISSGLKLNPDQNYNYAGLVILCSFLYALNVNIIKKYLQHLSALTKVMLIGHLGDEVKIHRFEDGGCVGRFPLATNETYMNKQTNERVSNTEWHNIVLRNKAAEICEKYLSKGDKVYIEGRIKTRKWQDDKGNDRYSTEINCTEFTFLSNKNDMPAQPDNSPVIDEKKVESVSDSVEETDDLPF